MFDFGRQLTEEPKLFNIGNKKTKCFDLKINESKSPI